VFRSDENRGLGKEEKGEGMSGDRGLPFAWPGLSQATKTGWEAREEERRESNAWKAETG